MRVSHRGMRRTEEDCIPRDGHSVDDGEKAIRKAGEARVEVRRNKEEWNGDDGAGRGRIKFWMAKCGVINLRAVLIEVNKVGTIVLRLGRRVGRLIGCEVH